MAADLLAGDTLGNNWPLIANLVVLLNQHQLLLYRPVALSALRTQVVLVTNSPHPYRYRHCFALLRGIPKSTAIFLAITLQLRNDSSSYSWRIKRSYSYDQIFFYVEIIIYPSTSRKNLNSHNFTRKGSPSRIHLPAWGTVYLPIYNTKNPIRKDIWTVYFIDKSYVKIMVIVDIKLI